MNFKDWVSNRYGVKDEEEEKRQSDSSLPKDNSTYEPQSSTNNDTIGKGKSSFAEWVSNKYGVSNDTEKPAGTQQAQTPTQKPTQPTQQTTQQQTQTKPTATDAKTRQAEVSRLQAEIEKREAGKRNLEKGMSAVSATERNARAAQTEQTLKALDADIAKYKADMISLYEADYQERYVNAQSDAEKALIAAEWAKTKAEMGGELTYMDEKGQEVKLSGNEAVVATRNAYNDAVYNNALAVKSNADFEENSKPMVQGELLGNTNKRIASNVREQRYNHINGFDTLLGNFQGDSNDFEKYDYMNEDERAVYNYLYNTQGVEAADDFLNKIDYVLVDRKAGEIEKKANTGIEKALLGINAGFADVGTAVEAYVNGADVKQTASQVAAGNIRQQLEEGSGFGNWLTKAGMDLGRSTAFMVPSLAVGAFTGGIGAAATTLALSGANAYNQKIQEGYTEEQAKSYGVLVGASEATLQYLLGGISKLGGKYSVEALTPRIAGIQNGFWRFAAQWGASMASEGIEEGLQEVIEPIFATMALDEKYEAAELGDVAYAFLLGAASAGGIEGVSIGINTAQMTKQGKELGKGLQALDDASLNDLINKGLNSEKGSTAYIVAEKLQKQIANGQKPNAYQLGTLYAEAQKLSAATQPEETQPEQTGNPGQFDTEPTDPIEQTATEMFSEEQTEEELPETLEQAAEMATQSEEQTVPDELPSAEQTPLKTAENANTKTVTLKDFGEVGQKTVQKIAKKEGRDATQVAMEIRTAYELGANTDVTMAQAHNTFATEAQVEAFIAGRTDRVGALGDGAVSKGTMFNKGEGGFVRTKAANGVDYLEIAALNRMGKALGVKIRFDEQVYEGNANGVYKNGEVVIAKDAKNPYMVVAKHEITHYMQKTAPKEYLAYRKVALEIEAAGGKTIGELINERMEFYASRGVPLTTDQAMDELAADFTEKLLTDYSKLDAFLNEMNKTEEKRNIVQRFFDSVREFFSKIKKSHKGDKKAQDEAAEERYGATLEQLERAEEAWKAMFKATRDNAVQAREGKDFIDEGSIEEGTGGVRYSLVTDQETLDFLNNQEQVKVYRAMQMVDGKLYPPMAALVADETGKKKLVEATKQDAWYQADENPRLIKFEVKVNGKKRNLTAEEINANEDVLFGESDDEAIVTLKDGNTVKYGELKPKFELNKGNGAMVPAAYNPYFHTSATPLNDQFSSAFDRPNLVVVEGFIPKSELTSEYKAQYAKDAVGEAKWHAGPVAGKLRGEKARRVFLSRWFKVDRVLSDSEVAKTIATILDGENIAVPWNVVTPSLRVALEAEGVEIDYKDTKMGSKVVTFESTQQGEGQYSLKGVRKDGIEVYETSQETLNLSWKERKAQFLDIMANEYAGRTAKFVRNGHAYYATFDKVDVKKNIYGDKLSDDKGRDAKINAGADGDIFEVVENAQYDGSKPEKGKKNKAHNGVGYWDYFIKKVQIDGTVYDLLANVRKKATGEFVYSLQLNEDKNTKAAPPETLRKTSEFNGAQAASDGTVSQPEGNVKGEFSLKDSSPLSEADQENANKVIQSLKTSAVGSRIMEGYATYTKERMDREIRSSIASGVADYAQSYITWVNPIDFVYATTINEKGREQLKQEAGALDIEKLKRETQPIHLTVNFETGEIVGHEGRHRMLALQAAGINKVPVIIDALNDNRRNTKPIEMMRLKGQKFAEYQQGTDFYLHNMLPLSERYADTAVKLFTSKPESGVQFSLKGAEPVTTVNVGDETSTFEENGKQYSIKSMRHDIAEGKMFDDLEKAGVFTREETSLLRDNLNKLIEYMLPNANILDMNEDYTKGNRPFSAYKPNSDPLYKISLDFSTLCRKRLMTQYVIEQLQLRENRPMTAEEQIAIRSMLLDYSRQEKALQVACAMCYVEAARLKAPKQMERFFNETEDIMRKYFAKADKNFDKRVEEAKKRFKVEHGYEEDTPAKDLSSKDKKAFDKMVADMRKAYVPDAEQQAIIDEAVNLPRSTFLTAENLTKLSAEHPEIYDAYTAHIRASTRSKSLESDIPYYYGDSADKVTDSFIEGVNAENGFRFDSWSDFQMKHMLDMITAVIDLSVRKSKMHGYTKFPEMVRIFGKTGMMFNLSGVTSGRGLNSKGELIFSSTEGINFEEAIKLREEFPETAGLQCIGVNKDHILALLRSPYVDYVIPYHTSGMNATLRKMAGIYEWSNYESTQHARPDPKAKKPADAKNWQKEPVWSEFYVAEGKDGYDIMEKTAKRYVEMCHERGLIPKFDEFANEPNYWKLLIDRKMINQATGEIIVQQPVKPIFDFSTIEAEIDREVEHYDPTLEQKAFDYIVKNFDAVGDRIKDLKKNNPKKKMETVGNEILQAYAKGSLSLKGSSELLRENARLKEVNTALREQFKTTKFAKVDKKELDKFAKNLLKDYESGSDINEVREALDDLYTYIANGEDGQSAVWEDVADKARAVAKLVLDGSLTQNNDLYQEYKSLRDYLRKTKIQIPDKSFDKDLAGYESINEFRKLNFGRLNLVKDGTPVESIYQELSGMYPEYFNEDDTPNPSDQLVRIAEVLDELQPVWENPYSNDMRGATSWLASDIIERFYELPQAKPTFADKAQRKLTEQAIKDRKKLDRLREEKNNRIAKLIEKGREKVKATRANEQIKRAEAVEKVKEHYVAKEERARARQKTSVLRNKIKKHVEKINKMLLNPNDNSHVPESMRNVVANLLAEIDLTTPRQKEKTINRLNNLRKMYEKIANNESDILVEVDPDLMAHIDIVTHALENGGDTITVADLNGSELEALYRTLLAVERSIYMHNKAMAYEQTVAISELSRQAMSELATDKDYKEHNRLAQQLANMVNMDMLNPQDFFMQMGGTMTEMYQHLRDSFDKKIKNLAFAKKYFQELVGDADIRTISGKKAVAKTFETEGGEKIRLTPAQVMSLYLLSKQPDALNHIYEGGIKPAPVVALDGKNRTPKVTRSYEVVKVTPTDVAEILKSMTDEQKRIADGVGKFFTEHTAQWGNDVSLALYGYKKFTVENYFPIVSDKNYLKDVFGETTDATLKNMGSTKARIQGANNPIIIEDVMDVFSRQADTMSSYNAFVIPLSDIQRVFNYKTGNGSVKQSIEKRFGIRATSYFKKFMTDVNGGARWEGGSAFLNELISKYKQAKMGLNIRVLLQQPTAMIRAAAVIDGKYLAEALVKEPRVDINKIYEYAPIAEWKDWGFFSLDTGKQMKDIMVGTKKIQDYTMWFYGKADELAWKRIWVAAELEIRATHPELKVGSTEYDKAVGKRFSEIVDRTQVVDSVFHRAQMMRSPDSLVRMSVSFMNEPFKAYNMMRTAVVQAKSNPGKAARKAVTAAISAYLGSIIVNHLITALVDTYRGDEDDEEWIEKMYKGISKLINGETEDETEEPKTWLERYLWHFADNLVNEPLSMFPYVKDVVSMIQGYDVKRMDMQGLGDLVNAAKTGLSDKYTAFEKITILSSKVADLFGLPASNVKRELNAAMKTGLAIADNPMAEYIFDKMFYRVESNQSRYLDILYNAYKQGDTEAYNKIAAELIEQGIKPSAIENGIKLREKKENPVPKKEKEEKFNSNILSGKEWVKYDSMSEELVKETQDYFNRNGLSRLDEETAKKLVEAAYDYAEYTALLDVSGADVIYKDESGKTYTHEQYQAVLWDDEADAKASDFTQYIQDDGKLYESNIPKWVFNAQNADDLGLTPEEYMMLRYEYSSDIGAEGVYKAYDAGVDVETYLEFKDGVKNLVYEKDVDGARKAAVIKLLDSMGLSQDDYDYLFGTMYKTKEDSTNNGFGIDFGSDFDLDLGIDFDFKW